MAAHSGRRAIAVLVFSGLGMIGVAAAALLRFPLLMSYQIRVLTLGKQVSATPDLGLMLVLATMLAFACYVAGFMALRNLLAFEGRQWPLLALVLTPPLVCAALLLFVYPATSLDLYDYLYRGHMAAHYGANNFIQTPRDLRGLDQLYWYTAWRKATTAYGPLWELLSIGVARLVGPGLLGLVLGFKLTSLIGWLLTAGAIAVASDPQNRLGGLYLWLWNPLVLWELVGAAHNDGWMLACVIFALACLRRWPIMALMLVTAGALFKYSAGLLWPVVLAAAVAQTPGWRQRLALVLGAGLASAALVLLACAPWWGLDILEQLRDRRALVTSTPLAVVYALLRGHMPKEELVDLINRSAATLLAGGLLVASWLAWRRPAAIATICAGLLLWVLTAGTAWFQPWYLVWPIGILALHQTLATGNAIPLDAQWPVRLFWILGAMSLGSLLSYPAFDVLRPWLDWPAKEASWQALSVGLIYGPPLLTLALLWLRSLKRRRLFKTIYQRQEAA